MFKVVCDAFHSIALPRVMSHKMHALEIEYQLDFRLISRLDFVALRYQDATVVAVVVAVVVSFQSKQASRLLLLQ